MPITSLKLSETLKKRVQKLVEGTDKSAHAFMVEAIESAAERAELRQRFGEEAAQAEADTERSGKIYDAVEFFDYLEARARGATAKRPRTRTWRRSG